MALAAPGIPRDRPSRRSAVISADFDLSGRTALITGAAGLRQQHAAALVEIGARMISMSLPLESSRGAVLRRGRLTVVRRQQLYNILLRELSHRTEFIVIGSQALYGAVEEDELNIATVINSNDVDFYPVLPVGAATWEELILELGQDSDFAVMRGMPRRRQGARRRLRRQAPADLDGVG
jgi:hypothetical protein